MAIKVVQKIVQKRIHPVITKALAIYEDTDKKTNKARFTVRLLEYNQKQDMPIACTNLRTFETAEEAVEYIKSK